MLRADGVRFDYSFAPPTLAEFVFVVTLLWVVGLLLIVGGTYGLNRRKSGWVELLALITMMIGFGACILVGWYFTPFNRNHIYVWVEDRDISYWIDLCLGLMILGTSLLFCVVGGKIGKRGVKRTEQNAN